MEKVLGRGVYGVDLTMPGMLHGKIVYSKKAHAKIVSIDTSKAKALPGVRAVITSEDMPFTYGSTVKDRPIFAMGKVRYRGEAVAAVAAISEEIAEEAAELIAVEYEEIKILLDPAESMKDTENLIHDGLGGYKHSYAASPIPGTNVCSHFKLRKGDVEKGFAEADLVLEKTYTTQMVQHVPLEPHVSVAHVNEVTGQITVWTGTVSPYTVRSELADALKWPMSKIRVIVPEIGGSFGSKMYLKTEPYSVALSMKTGVPVQISLSREEEFNMTVKGPTISTIKTGVMKDGTIVARSVETLWDTGAYADCGPRIGRNSGHTCAGPYKIPNIRIDGYCIYTNKNVGGAFRGYGVQELCFAYESHMDDIAEVLKMDPVEIRLKNALMPGNEGATGQIVEAGDLVSCIKKAAESIGWYRKEKRPYHGYGIAAVHKATGAPSASSVFIKMNEDGTLGLLTSTVEQGQGSNTVLAQIAAEELGVDPDDVYISAPDTDYSPFDSTTTSSRSTFCMGNAILLAARDVKAQLAVIASDIFQVGPEDIELGLGELWVKSDPQKRLKYREIIGKYYGSRGGTILGRGFFRPDADPADPETGQTRKMTPFWMYGSQAAEVEIDPETGKVRVLKLTAAHDMGRAINPINCYQQVEGALIMGMSGAIYEELKIDSQGKTLNANLHDYKVAGTMDIPEMEVHLIEAPQPDGPFGAKGLGEPALAATAPAIANAIYDAIGVRILDLPLTHEKILKAIQDKNQEK
jgi:carbon-monoxide dehydrogenase large subunit